MEDCKHFDDDGNADLISDAFATVPGVTRYVVGNACCAKCGKPMPYDIQRGKAIYVGD